MTSLKLLLVVLQTYWATAGLVFAEGFSENILNLMAVLNGNLDNSAQIGDSQFDFIQAKIVPVAVPALPGKPVVYMEQAVNGVVYRMILVELREDSDGVFLSIPYNFTDFDQYTPGSFNIGQIANIKTEDLSTDEDCVGTFTLVAPAVYNVIWPDCRQFKIDGHYPAYNVTLTCSIVTFNPTIVSKEKNTSEPYHFHVIGQRYPVIGAPADYISPCDKKD